MTTTETAELLARECASHLDGARYTTEIILANIPLVELLNVVKALESVEWLNGEYGTSMQNSVFCPACASFHDKLGKDRGHHKHCKIGNVLTALRAKLPKV